ncbi:MAG TPA: hypothetical protein IAB02_00995, partial [Candidatus Pullichristensenella excrementigallinarum]|nr:hypothetical protein [Candidatus Pullichristensenella excrementigallinarum]
MNPFLQNPRKLEDCLVPWSKLYIAPYDKNSVDPYTRTRVILANGSEFASVWLSHHFSRHCPDNELRRQIALLRRAEQQQQKRISMLKPANETILEHTIGYEQLAVDLTAALAQMVPDPYVKQALDFALLEDFDHLYRYADLLDMEAGIHAEDLVGRYTEIMPGRPTLSHHRHPFDSIQRSIDPSAQTMTKLAVGVITSAEQQTMNFYMNVCGIYQSEIGRKLYQEIGMVEEEHVSQYASLLNPQATWLEKLLTQQYAECWLYWSATQTEKDPRIRAFWEELFEEEITHLHFAANLLKHFENKEWQQILPDGEFPQPLLLKSNIEYIRNILRDTAQLTAVRESWGDVDTLHSDFDFFRYQEKIQSDIETVPSHRVIER